MAQCAYSYFLYVLQPGDTLQSVSKRFSVSEKVLRDSNGIDRAVPGQQLKIPCVHGGCGNGTFYTLRHGETLLAAACRHGLALADLLSANPYVNPNEVEAGQVIVIPPAQRAQADDAYTLGEGEGLFDVLRKFGMDLTTFCTLNQGVKPMDVQSGQTVQVKRRMERGGRWYTLGHEDTLVSVAERHGIAVSALLSANERLRPSDFVPGMPVRIPG